MNLLKALNALNVPQTQTDATENKQPPAQNYESASAPVSESAPATAQSYPNVMQSVLVRHEQVANRVKRKQSQ